MAGFVRRVTVVRPAEGSAEVVYKDKAKKKKVSRWLRRMEKAERRMAEAIEAFGAEMAHRHNKSNTKRRNGFIRDRGLNIRYANRKALKQLLK